MKTWIAILPLALLLLGCGGGSGGPKLYHLKGEVTFDGKPVVHGRVDFEPDTSKGNTGGTGYADIVDGKYDTSSAGGRGVIGGPHIVHFTGYDAKPPAPSADGTLDETSPTNVSPNLIFSDYRQEHDLAQSHETLNFTLPADAASTLSITPAAQRPANDP